MRTALRSLVGSVFGLAFVVGNAGGLPAGWPWPVRLLGLAAFAAVLWSAVVRVWHVRESAPTAPGARRSYGAVVAGFTLLAAAATGARRRPSR